MKLNLKNALIATSIAAGLFGASAVAIAQNTTAAAPVAAEQAMKGPQAKGDSQGKHRAGDGVGQAGIAVTIFSAFMAGGRFAGDWLKRHLGGVMLARVTVCSAMLGMLLLVLPLPVVLAYPGFALVGFGVSAAYPLGVSAIAALDDRYESANIAIMATVALGGFLVGPPVIGTGTNFMPSVLMSGRAQR